MTTNIYILTIPLGLPGERILIKKITRKKNIIITTQKNHKNKKYQNSKKDFSTWVQFSLRNKEKLKLFINQYIVCDIKATFTRNINIYFFVHPHHRADLKSCYLKWYEQEIWDIFYVSLKNFFIIYFSVFGKKDEFDLLKLQWKRKKTLFQFFVSEKLKVSNELTSQ